LILAKIEKGISKRQEGWVEKWIKGDTSILEDIIMPYEAMVKTLNENPSIKNDILNSLDDITRQELQSCGIRAKPECHEIWCCESAAERMDTELQGIKTFIKKI
jgi:hypothetical protein